MIFSQEHKIVRVYGPIDATGATIVTDILSLKGYDHCTFILAFGICNTSAATTTNLIAYKGKNVATADTVFACQGYRAEITASGDTLEALTAMPDTGVSIGSGNTLDIDTGLNFIVVEIDAADLAPTIADPYDTVRLGMVWAGQTTELSIIAILSKGRYQDAALPTAITD